MITSSKNYKWFLVAMLWFVALLNYLDRQMLSTMRPSMQQDIHELLSAENFGKLMAIFLWIYGFISPVAGVISDKLNRKWLVVTSLFIWSLVTYAMSLTVNYQQLYILRALMGISEAIYVPCSLAMIVDFHSSKTRSLAVGLYMTGVYVGQALGGYGAVIAKNFSWQYAFALFGGAGITFSILLILLLKAKPEKALSVKNKLPGRKEEKPIMILPGLKVLFRNPAFWVILLYFALPGIPGWAVKNWLPTLFSDNLKIDMSQAGPLATLTVASSSLLGVLFGGRLSDRWARHSLKARTITSAIGVTLTIPALLIIGQGNSLSLSLIAAVCFGFGFGMFDANNMPIVCQFVSKKYRATAYGFMNMIGVFAGAMATTALGKYSDNNNLGQAFGMLAGLVLIAVLLQQIFLNPKTDDFKEA